jgi:hypothetical protein
MSRAFGILELVVTLVHLRSCVSRKLKFSNMNTKADVFDFMFENRGFTKSESSSRFFFFSGMKNTNQCFVS